MKKRRNSSVCTRLVLAGVANTVVGVTLAMAQVCPATPVTSVAGAATPKDVCIPAGFTGLTIEYFDDYSWKAFIAMIWPSVYGGRGVADAERTHTGSGPRVFETFKPLWEIFHRDGSPPTSSDYREYEAPLQNACQTRAGFGEMVRGSDAGFHDIGQSGDGGLLGPLVAQNGTYVRYLTSYNEIAFRHIESNRWYLRKALPVVPVPRPLTPLVQFPDGSIVVKSAWMETEGLTEAQRKRIYVRMATVKDVGTGKCKKVAVGLIGIHIVQKTPSRPQWIWSSFEQVDLVPPAEPDGPGKYLLNDGSGAPMPRANPRALIPLAKTPAEPFNVERAANAPIHPQTVETNAKYRKLVAGSVWQNYQLVVTQWPLAPGDQSIPVKANQAGDIFQTFPGEGATSAYSNLTLETFHQARPAQGCMNCHNRARLGADFLWSVLMHAYPEQVGLPAAAVTGETQRPSKKK